MDGLNVAHGARPALIGKNLITLKDQDGKFLVRDMRDIAKTPGLFLVYFQVGETRWTDKIEDKASYVERMGGFWIGVGVYR